MIDVCHSSSLWQRFCSCETLFAFRNAFYEMFWLVCSSAAQRRWLCSFLLCVFCFWRFSFLYLKGCEVSTGICGHICLRPGAGLEWRSHPGRVIVWLDSVMLVGTGPGIPRAEPPDDVSVNISCWKVNQSYKDLQNNHKEARKEHREMWNNHRETKNWSLRNATKLQRETKQPHRDTKWSEISLFL